jgi:hypothetical protein
MKRSAHAKLTPEALVEAYVAIGIEQDQAIENFDTRKFNRLYPRKRAIADELKSRPGDQRTYLVPLLQHPNWQVRMNAANELLAVVPLQARATLQAIADSKHYPHAGHAGMALWALDQGISPPT